MSGGDLTGVNGDSITEAEAKAIRSLMQLAKRWPSSLTLLSMGSRLEVMHTGDERFAGPRDVRCQVSLVSIEGIPNDGGDW